nr:sensory neuron membrane protein 2a [Podabrus annulatus]
MASKNIHTCSVIYFAVSVLLSATFLTIVFVVMPQIIQESVESNVQLLDNTIQFDRFMELPLPVYFKVHIFGIENPAEVLRGETPRVKEIGPYVYTETRIKNLTSLKTDTLTYSEKWKFKYDVLKSNNTLSENDEIQIINVALFALLQSLEDLNLPIPISLEQLTSEILEDNNIFTTVKVREYAFEGIKMCDPYKNLNHWTVLVCTMIILMNQKILKYEPDGLIRFSLFGYKEKDDGPFILHRGITEIDKLGLVTSYKGQEYTEFWNRSSKTSCDHVNGHTALFPPFMEKTSSYKIYSTDICKTGNLNFAEETKYRDIGVYRFQTDAKSFSSSDEPCVCIKKTKDIDGEKNCLNEGILDLSTCFGGAPVILSMPHFMFAGQKYINSIRGIQSNYTLDHNTFLEFEPHLGFPLKAAIRIQFNTVLRPMLYRGEVVPKTAYLPRALFPLLWIEDSFEMTEELLEEINEKLVGPLALAEILKWTLIALSALLLLSSIGLIIYHQCKTKQYKMT